MTIDYEARGPVRGFLNVHPYPLSQLRTGLDQSCLWGSRANKSKLSCMTYAIWHVLVVIRI